MQPTATTRARAVVIAHPSPDLYGSDRQLLETVSALVADGWTVTVVLPLDGPLVPELERRGATTALVPFPVLRKAVLHPRRLPGFALGLVRAAWGSARALRRERPACVLVNTLTLPSWLVGARLAGVPTLCHVHEAEEDQPAAVRLALAAQLLSARVVVANSHAAAEVLRRSLRAVQARIRVVHNGVAGPERAPAPPREVLDGPARLTLVGRLSPRKGIDVALEAVRLLRGEGRDVHLAVCGTPFPGYEWYQAELEAAAASPGLNGAVSLLGYVHPTWPLLEQCDVALVPSRVEPFGNTAVEALLAQRPLVASRTQGLQEVVKDGTTGLLVPPDDAPALATAIGKLLDDRLLASELAAHGRADAVERFSVPAYAQAIVAAVEATAG
jgi:glycosyltransferase involved in cell wall biosynthesis